MSSGNTTGQDQLIWEIAELLRGGWKQYEYQDVILPLVVLKRLDAMLAGTKPALLEMCERLEKENVDRDPILKKAAGADFYNCSKFDFDKLLDDPAQIAKNFRKYLQGFSPNVQDIFSKFDFDRQLERLSGGNMLYMVVKALNRVDLHPERVSNHDMGAIFENLIRRFNEQSNETAGEHYTPREVIKMMVEVLLSPDSEDLKRENKVKTVYDCACGTGGMLSTAKEHILEAINPKAKIYLFGQELNAVTYAVCKSDMLIKGDNPERIKGGDKDHAKASTLSNDQFADLQFDYLLTNPPFGVDWKKDKEAVEREHEMRAYSGRFGAGLPRISDGQLLFLQHMVSKMRPVSDGGARLAIVFNGSPLFTGDAGSGESEIRRWILEKDWLDAIIALPDQLFFNTGINTYVWVLSNRKQKERKGLVQLVDARTFFEKERKSLGNKRHKISDANRERIRELYDAFEESEYSKIFRTTDFAYRQIIIERPLRLNFQASADRLTRLRTHKLFAEDVESTKKKAKDLDKEAILAALEKFGDKLYRNRETFVTNLEKMFEKAGLKVTTPAMKAVLSELSERDETADICLDANGNPESDSELRDTENVPWGRDVNEYFENEVRPYVPDAWINAEIRDHKDKKTGKVGYEIPFTRYFYRYQAPRDLTAIDADIVKVEDELLKLLKQI